MPGPRFNVPGSYLLGNKGDYLSLYDGYERIWNKFDVVHVAVKWTSGRGIPNRHLDVVCVLYYQALLLGMSFLYADAFMRLRNFCKELPKLPARSGLNRRGDFPRLR